MWKSVTVDYLVPLASKQTPSATFPRLPFSNGEAEAIGNILRQQNSDVHIIAPSSIDPSKLSEKLKSGEYVILHFTAHGVLVEPTKPRGDLTHGQDKQDK
jgi:CHAT domain-containing protein